MLRYKCSRCHGAMFNDDGEEYCICCGWINPATDIGEQGSYTSCASPSLKMDQTIYIDPGDLINFRIEDLDGDSGLC